MFCKNEKVSTKDFKRKKECEKVNFSIEAKKDDQEEHR